MKLRSVVAGALIAGAMSVAAGGSASANLVWCVADPPTQVDTSSGQNLTVNTMIFLDKASVHLSSDVTESVTTQPDGQGGTLITVRIQVPEGVSSARVVASVQRFKLYAAGYGSGGDVITLRLDAPIG